MHYSGEIAEQRIGCFVISQSVMDVFNLFEKRNGFEFGVYWIEKRWLRCFSRNQWKIRFFNVYKLLN